MVYLFHGDDVDASQETLAQLTQETIPPGAVDLAVTRLDGGTLPIGTLIEHCEALPFLSPKRLVVVDGIASRFGRKGRGGDTGLLEALKDYLPRMAKSTILIFWERTKLAAGHSLVVLVKKVGKVREFAAPRARDLSRWIAQQVRREGAEITPAACDLLAATVGTDPAVLRREVEKLVTYVGLEGRIDERLVAELASEARLSNIFALVDAIGQRRRARAMLELHRLLQAGQHPLYILTMLVRQVRLLLQVKGLPVGDRRPDRVARALNVHPFVAEKIVAQAQSFRPAELEQVHHQLVETDRKIKTGRRDGEVALELLVTEVAVY